jgi:hypothetical protein
MPDPLPLPRIDAPRPRAAALACLWLALAVVACSEDEHEPCNLCPGTSIFAKNQCETDPTGYRWEVEINGRVYELACGDNLQNQTARDYDRVVNCDHSGLNVGIDVDEIRVRASEIAGDWSTQGWQIAAPDRPFGCGGCQYRVISVAGRCDLGDTADAGR